MDTVKLYEENEKLAYFIANKWRSKVYPSNMEDLYQEAKIALWAASKSYNPDKGIKFSTYVTNCINHKIINFMQRKIPQIQPEQEISLFTQLLDADYEFTFENVLESNMDIENDIFTKQILDEVKNDEILKLRYLDGYTQKQVGEMLGISQMSVSRMIRKKIADIRGKWAA